MNFLLVYNGCVDPFPAVGLFCKSGVVSSIFFSSSILIVVVVVSGTSSLIVKRWSKPCQKLQFSYSYYLIKARRLKYYSIKALVSAIRKKKSSLKCGFHNKSFILNAPLVSCPIPVIRSGWVQQQTHPKRMTGIGQLTRGAFRINDLL